MQQAATKICDLGIVEKTDRDSELSDKHWGSVFRSKTPAEDEEYRKHLLSELAALDQKIENPASSSASAVGVGMAKPIDPTLASLETECTDADMFRPNPHRHMTLEVQKDQTLKQNNQEHQEVFSTPSAALLPEIRVSCFVSAVASAEPEALAAPSAPSRRAAAAAVGQDLEVAGKVHQIEAGGAACARSALGREGKGGGSVCGGRARGSSQ